MPCVADLALLSAVSVCGSCVCSMVSSVRVHKTFLLGINKVNPSIHQPYGWHHDANHDTMDRNGAFIGLVCNTSNISCTLPLKQSTPLIGSVRTLMFLFFSVHSFVRISSSTLYFFPFFLYKQIGSIVVRQPAVQNPFYCLVRTPIIVFHPTALYPGFTGDRM